MAEYRSKALTIGFVLVISTVVGFARTIVVALDGSGDFTRISEAAEVAVAGDSILVRDGDYYEEEFSVDSAVVVFAENHGAARIWAQPGSEVIVLRGSAELVGFSVFGNYLAIHQVLLQIGGPAVVYNCEFLPAARFGLQLSIYTQGFPPFIRHCRFYLSGSSHIAENYDSTDIWMPYNYYGTLDTTTIHWFIRDGHDYPGRGYITVSPVADTFEWLALDPRSPIAQDQQIQLYPNPSNGVISINMKGLQTIQQIDVFNILGQRVYTLSDARNPQGSTLKFNLPLPSGNYFISVSEPKSHQIARLTIVR